MRTLRDVDRALAEGAATRILELRQDDVGDAALWRWSRCRALIQLGDLLGAISEGQYAWDLIEEVADPELRGRIALDYGCALAMAGGHRLALKVLRWGIDRAGVGGRVLRYLHENYGQVLCSIGELDSGLAHLMTAADMARSDGAMDDWARARYLMGRWLYEAGEPAAAASVLEEVLEVLEGCSTADWARIYYGRAILDLGDISLAEQLAYQVLDAAGARLEVAAAALTLLCAVARKRGEDEKALELATRAQAMALAANRDDIFRQAAMELELLAAKS